LSQLFGVTFDVGHLREEVASATEGWLASRPTSILNVDTLRGGGMRARVQRWGNSLALRIPRAFGRELNLRPESSVEMTLDSGRLILVPIEDSRVPTLSELLDQVSDENKHTEVETGRPVGNETW